MPRSSDQESEYGWVFDHPDVGEQFSVDHPVTSGECDDATNIRPATFTERWLWDGMQAEFQNFLTQENKNATLTAERDAALVAVEGIERFLGIRDGASGLEQIARDIKSGTFPKKSEQTLAEEAEAARLHNLITASIRSGAPGLSETTCSAIAQSVALKIRHAVSSLPTAQVKG